jgi:hypothetical protein
MAVTTHQASLATIPRDALGWLRLLENTCTFGSGFLREDMSDGVWFPKDLAACILVEGGTV